MPFSWILYWHLYNAISVDFILALCIMPLLRILITPATVHCGIPMICTGKVNRTKVLIVCLMPVMKVGCLFYPVGPKKASVF